MLVRLTVSPSFELDGFAEQHRADFFLFQVERDSKNVVRKRQHLAGHDFVEPVNARDAVADADDRPDFVDRDGLLVVCNLLAQNFADFVCLDIRHSRSVAVLVLSVVRRCPSLGLCIHRSNRRAATILLLGRELSLAFRSTDWRSDPS